MCTYIPPPALLYVLSEAKSLLPNGARVNTMGGGKDARIIGMVVERGPQGHDSLEEPTPIGADACLPHFSNVGIARGSSVVCFGNWVPMIVVGFQPPPTVHRVRVVHVPYVSRLVPIAGYNGTFSRLCPTDDEIVHIDLVPRREQLDCVGKRVGICVRQDRA